MNKSWKQYLRKDPVCPHCARTIGSIKGVERVSNQVIKCPQCGTELSFTLRFPLISYSLAGIAGLASAVAMFGPESVQAMNTSLQVFGGVCTVAFVLSMMQLKFVGQE